MISWPRPRPISSPVMVSWAWASVAPISAGQLGQRRQVGVDGQRADRAERAEHEDQLDVAGGRRTARPAGWRGLRVARLRAWARRARSQRISPDRTKVDVWSRRRGRTSSGTPSRTLLLAATGPRAGVIPCCEPAIRRSGPKVGSGTCHRAARRVRAIKADHGAQLRLLDLQSVDSALAQLDHRRRTLPEHAELARLREERAAVASDLVAADTAVADLELRAGQGGVRPRAGTRAAGPQPAPDRRRFGRRPEGACPDGRGGRAPQEADP